MGCAYPKFTVSVDKLTFQNKQGAWFDPPAQRFKIERVPGGGKELRWAIGSSESWIIPQPSTGEGSKSIRVIVHTRKLPVGIYNAELTIVAPGNDPKAIQVVVVIA